MVRRVLMMARRLTDLFPAWALLLSTVAFLNPGPFLVLKSWITPLLGLVMLAMGLTLGLDDFRLISRRPRVVATGVALQFLLMPLIALGVARGLGLDAPLTAGVVLVGACPGGTASNVIAYLAKGDVALSITLTSVSTLLGVLFTPALTWLYLDTTITVPAREMLVSVLEVVLLPVAVGVLVNTYFGGRLHGLRPWLPVLSVVAIVLIIAIIVGLTADRLTSVGGLVLCAVALHNAGGLAGGYLAGRALGFTGTECRTLAIEVGMQNSGLGVALATRHFTAVAALPGAVFSIWHNVSGSLLAGWWARRSA